MHAWPCACLHLLHGCATDCPLHLQVGEGLDLSSRYAVIVSFGVLLNGTALNEIAQRVGVNASSEVVLDTLVR